jgi:uncharacterized protein YggU (UPF0235/DUF167 family)
VGGEHDGRLIVRVRERTVEGKATEAVRRALAEAIGVSAAHVRVVSGATSRRKVLEVDSQFVDVVARVDELKRAGLEGPPSPRPNR